MLDRVTKFAQARASMIMRRPAGPGRGSPLLEVADILVLLYTARVLWPTRNMQ